MVVDRAIDITAEQRKTVLSLLERYLPGVEAWVYGSRAKWTARPQSDLDLVVFATPEQKCQVADLTEAFEESDLPFRVYLFVWDAVPEEFYKHIERDHVVLVAKTERRERDGWTSVQLGDVVDLLAGFPFKSDKYVTHPRAPRLLRGDNVAQGTLRWDGTKRWPREATESLAPYWLRQGDVVIAMDRPWIEAGLKYSLVRETDIPALLVQRVARLRGSDRLYNRFLNYVIGGRDFTEYVLSVQTGTAIPHISSRQIKEFEFRLPPLNEQRAIAHILGTLDDKIDLNRRMSETLEAMTRAMFKSWFVDFDPVRAKMEGRDTGLPKQLADLFPDRLVDSELDEIPEGWVAGTLGDIVSLNPETWKSSCPPRTVSYVDLTNAKWGCIENVKSYAWKEAPSRARRVLRKRDTIIATVRPGNGSFALIDEDGLTGSTGFAILRPRNAHDREQVWCAATSSGNIDRLAHLADGGAYPAVGTDSILATPIVLADAVLRKTFAVFTGALLDRAEANKRESRILVALRDSLLPNLISGELRVRGVCKFLGRTDECPLKL